MSSRVLVVIPAYNEAQNIATAVDDLVRHHPHIDYIVVNDGSQDNTGGICIQNKYNVMHYCVNIGITNVFYGGLLYAYKNKYDYIIQYDGDGQHCAEYIKQMIKIAEQEKYDIVIGSRFVSADRKWSPRMLGSRMIGVCFFMVTGQKIWDPTSGMRLYNRRTMQYMIDQMSFSPEPDSIALLARQNFRFVEYPVHMRERGEGQSSLNLISGMAYVVSICLSILLTQWFRKNSGHRT